MHSRNITTCICQLYIFNTNLELSFYQRKFEKMHILTKYLLNIMMMIYNLFSFDKYHENAIFLYKQKKNKQTNKHI